MSGFVGLVGLTLLAIVLVLLPGFANLEHRDAVQQVARSHEALAEKLAALHSKTGDWANWTDNYRFVLGQNPSFADEASKTSFSELSINIVAIVDRSGRVLLGRAFDLQGRKWTAFPTTLVTAIIKQPAFMSRLHPGSRLTGIVSLSSGPMLIAARPVLTSAGQGPVHGVLIFGRHLDGVEVASLSRTLHLPVVIVDARSAADSPQPSLQPDGTWIDRAATITINRNNTLAGDVTIADIEGRPAFALRQTIPRVIYDRGRLTALYFLITISGVGFTLGLVLLVIFQRLSSTQIAQQETERRYRAIFAQAAEGILLVEPDSQAILESNPACSTLLGWSVSGLLEKTVAEISPSLGEAAARFAPTMATQTSAVAQEIQYDNPQGSRLVLEVSGGAIDSDGRLTTLLMLRDVTTRYEAEVERNSATEAWLAKEAADRANQQKSEFLSRMSHELRTPLNAVLGFAQLLEMEDLQPSHRENLEFIVKGGHHLLNLINEVLNIARIETGRIAFALEPVSAQELTLETLDLIRPLATKRNIQVRANLGDHDDVHVLADRQRLKQVLLNLLSNAVKYNRMGGTVALSYERRENRLRIRVADTGPGISPAGIQRLFTPFERLDAEQTAVEGIGLGLSLSKRFMEAMDGAIGVESEVGEGSIFWVELPVIPGPASQLDPFTESLSVGAVEAPH